MKYRVMNNYEDANGWNEDEVFSSNDLNECIREAQEWGGWFSEECFVNVVDENDNVVWE